MADTLRVGLATVDFTPEPGLPLMGNFRDDYLARGTHDPLRAKAMVFEDAQGNKAALLTVDVCMLDAENVALMRQTVASMCDVPPNHVMIHATHTHSGPFPNGAYSFGVDLKPHRSAIEAFLRKAASAVALANEQLAESTLAIGSAHESRLAFNRRLRRHDGTTQMNWEALQSGFDPLAIDKPWGPTDPEVQCLVVWQQHRPVAALVNFALHAAVLAGDNWLYSADFPGYLAEAMSKALGDDFTCLFFNGCCGNVNHVDYHDPLQGRGYKMAQRIGYMLAATAQQAIRQCREVQVPRVTVSREQVELERITIDPEERARCEHVVADARTKPPQGQVDGLPEAYFADLRLKMANQQEQPSHAEVMALHLGEVALLGLPGENFCETGLEIKRSSPVAHTLVAGLTNDAIGYVPTREAFAQGGYEPTVGSTRHGEDTAERLIASATNQLNKLHRVKSTLK